MKPDILLSPLMTRIGSEPQDPTIDSSAHWERAMVGHSACNMVPVVASNRIGTEIFGESSITFYGTLMKPRVNRAPTQQSLSHSFLHNIPILASV